MANDRIAVPYNHKLKRFEALLAGVERAGSFFVQGSLGAPIPRIEVEGVGVLSFPVPASQIRALVKRAHRAPYGRGERTIVDRSVRNAWQIDSADVRISGKAWDNIFERIVSTVIAGLGCSGMKVSATLYKLLVYEAGGLFRPHRDTEKADGMFGTLVVVLPSAHSGGELIIRHGTREVSVNLSSPEVSDLTFAAFYADCEHEVKPIADGNRVCLTYNLGLAEKDRKHEKGKKRQASLAAPLHEREVAAAAEILKRTFRAGGAPTKLAWLLEHHYSAAGLSFARLKGQDAARVQVLSQAAESAACAAHLGIVHIEETGPADPHFDIYEHGGWRSGWDDDDASDEEEELDDENEAAVTEDFDVIEVSGACHYVDQWVDAQNRSVDFGKLPLKGDELLPAGALDNAAPDAQRLTEATGNEGASFERSYRRAALVMWPRNRSAYVLLQGGVRAVMPYLKDIAQRCRLPSASRAERAAARSIAGRLVRAWKRELADPAELMDGEGPSRPDMITILGQLADAALLEAFVNGVVIRRYDGSENEALAATAAWLTARRAAELFPTWRAFTCHRVVEHAWICSRASSTNGAPHPPRHGGAACGPSVRRSSRHCQNDRTAPLHLTWMTTCPARGTSRKPSKGMQRWWSRFSTALRPSMRRTCAAPRATPLPPPNHSTPPESSYRHSRSCARETVNPFPRMTAANTCGSTPRRFC
jgi:hypothetical protein